MSRYSRSTRNVTYTAEETQIRFYRKSKSNKKPIFSHQASYKNTAELASGGNGAVYKGHISEEDIPKIGEHPILIKKMRYFTDSRPESILDLPIEMRFEREVFEKRHGRYGKCFLSYEFHEDTKKVDVYLQMPEIPGISLSKIKDLELTLLDQLLIAQASAVVMCDFHSDEEFIPRLAHRDIKPANVMCEIVRNHFFIARLIDFGSCNKGNTKYVGSLAGSTLAYAAPYYNSGESKNLFQSDAFSLGIVLLEILGVKDFYKFRRMTSARIKKENKLKIKQYIKENEPHGHSNRYEQYIKDLKNIKNALLASRLKMITETEINHEGLLSAGLTNPDFFPYLDPVKQYLVNLTDLNSKGKIGLDQVNLVLGEAIGAIISYYLLQNVKKIEDEPYLAFSKNRLESSCLLDVLYSKPPHEYIEEYSGRILGANKFLKNHQEEYNQLGISTFNYFEEEGARRAFNSLFEKLTPTKLEEAINSLVNDTSVLEEQRLVLLDICSSDKDHLLPKFINNLNRKFRNLFDLTAENYNEDIGVFFNLIINKTLELYRTNDINEVELVEILTLFIVNQNSHHEENIHDVLIKTINRLIVSCTIRFLKSALQELRNEIEQMSAQAYRCVYKRVNKTLDENRLDCKIFSRFRSLLLALGENPSNKIIKIACTEFQEQCRALLNRLSSSNFQPTLLVSRRRCRRVGAAANLPVAAAPASPPVTTASERKRSEGCCSCAVL